MRLRLTLVMVPLILFAAAGGHLAGNLVARTPAREVELFSSWDSRAALLLLFGLAVFAVLVVAGAATAENVLRSLSPRPFAVLPPLIFTTGEIGEAVVSHASVMHALLAPAFGAGLLAQAPFAFIAFVIARFLYRVGAALWRAIIGDSGSKPIPVVPLVPRCGAGEHDPLQVAIDALRGRAPPHLRVSLA